MDRSGYRRLDLSKLKFNDSPISTEEALKDVEAFDIPQEVLNGKKKIYIDNSGWHIVDNDTYESINRGQQPLFFI